MVRKILPAAILVIVILSLLGCQTVQGLGRDITWTGEAVGNVLAGE